MMEHQRNKFKKLLEETQEVVDFYNKSIEDIKNILEYMDGDIQINEDDTIDTIILKKYMEYGNMKDVQKYINDSGYKVKTDSYIGSRKYTLDDISQTVYPYARLESQELKKVNADEELKEIVKKMHLYIFNSSYGRLRVKEFKK